MSGSPADPDPVRLLLGEMLQDRRVELDPRYRVRSHFAEEHGFSDRVIYDIEHGKRPNNRRSTLTALEVAYGLARGSIARFLAGGELEAAPGTPPAPARAAHSQVAELLPDIVREGLGDQLIARHVRSIWEEGGADLALRLILIGSLVEARRRYSNGPGSGAPAADQVK